MQMYYQVQMQVDDFDPEAINKLREFLSKDILAKAMTVLMLHLEEYSVPLIVY